MKRFLKSLLPLALLTIFSVSFFTLLLNGEYGNPDAVTIQTSQEQFGKPFENITPREQYARLLAMENAHSLTPPKEDAALVSTEIGVKTETLAPGLSVIAYPVYLLGSRYNLAQLATFSLITLFAIANILLLFRIAKAVLRLPAVASLTAPLIFAFATPSLRYATTLYDHHVTTFLMLSGFYAAWKLGKQNKWNWFFSEYLWVSYALAIAVNYSNAILLAPVLLYGVIQSVALHRAGNKLHVSLRPEFFVSGFLSLAAFAGTYLLLASKQMSLALPILSGYSEENLPKGLYTLLISPDRGIFLYSPIFLISLLGIASLTGKIKAKTATLLTITGLNLFLIASSSDPWGGWAFGPRLLIPSMAVMSLFAAVWINKMRDYQLAKIAVFFLAAYSSAVALMGALTTDAVPPQLVAATVQMKDNFLLNLDAIKAGLSSSYLYNTFLTNSLTLFQYFILSYAVLLIAFIIVLFLPQKRYDH